MTITDAEDPSVSYHFDSAADRADGRINPCDLYAFPATPGTTVLILTVNPDAGRSSPTTFWPDARYEFVVASDGGTSEDIAFHVSFTEPEDNRRQRVQVLRARRPGPPQHGGDTLGRGPPRRVFALGGDGLAWAGLAANPFSGDGIAIGGFLQGVGRRALHPLRYSPTTRATPSPAVTRPPSRCNSPTPPLGAPGSACGRGSVSPATVTPRNGRSAGSARQCSAPCSSTLRTPKRSWMP